MNVTLVRASLLACAMLGLAAATAAAQVSFEAPVVVVSEWKGQDRGDGSGSYELTTTARSGSVAIEHALRSERAVDGTVSDGETMRVLNGEEEVARAESDPSALGAWGEHAVRWAVPFGVGFDPSPRSNYRAPDKRVREVVTAVAPQAKVSTRAASDGRTTADVQLPETLPADELARTFARIRAALAEEGLGLARLRLRGQAAAPAALAGP